MEDEVDYEVDYEVDDTEEFPATLEMKQEPEPEPEPEGEPELELKQEPEPEGEGEPEPELDFGDQLEQLEVKQRKASKKRFGSSWKRPPTYVYACNFGFGVNSYQTMIDYLDCKDAGERVNKDDVHLPLLEERCLRKYHADRPFRWYDNHDIDLYTLKGEKIRTQIRQNDAVGIGNVLRRTHTNWSMTRKWMQLLKNSHVVDYRSEHKKTPGFDTLSYRAPSVVGSLLYPSLTPNPVKALDYLGPALTPQTRYLDELTAGLASALLSLAQSRMEHDQAMAQRRSRIRELDDRFDNTLDEIYSQMRRIGSRPEPPPPVRQLDLNDLDVSARNKIRRAEEMRDMMDYVNELTSLNSARNTLRENLRGGVGRDMQALDTRVENMRNLQKTERMKDVSSDYEIDMLRAEIAARRSMPSPASALLADRYSLPRAGSHFLHSRPVQLSAIDHLACRPREMPFRDDVISDVSARVLKRAGEVGGEPTDEQRRISSRARFVNLTRRRPETGDLELMGCPSRTERNIDHMAKSLASRGDFQRRYEVDEELELPYMGPFTTTRIDRGDTSISRLLERPESPSRMVRTAASRALARNTLLGY